MLFRTLLTIGLGLTLAAPALAQHPGYHRGHGGDQPRQRPISAEAALRHREQLKLTERQVTDLTAIRREGLKARQEQIAARMELSSRFRAGELSREEFRNQMHGRRDGAAPLARQHQERVHGVLDETQRTALSDMVRSDRRAMRRHADRPERMGRMGGGRPRP